MVPEAALFSRQYLPILHLQA